MALLLSPVLLGMVLWLVPTVVVLVVLAATRALDHVRRGPAPPAARRPERTVIRSGLPGS
jgi:hypothetical protein